MNKEPYIHPGAIIEDGASLGAGVKVGPFSLIGPEVELGEGVEIKSHVVITGRTTIGPESIVYPFASIGHAPQDLKYGGEKSRLDIGRNTVIREHVTMNPGTESGGMLTKTGDNCLFMIGSHIAHDCQIGNNVIMANNATLAGHVQVGDHCVIGGLAAVHQFVRIGAYAVIGGMSGVENDVIPFGRVKGDRAFLAGLNLVGLERGGFDKQQIRVLQQAFQTLFDDEGTMDDRIARTQEEFGDNEGVSVIIEFARNKNRFPLCRPR